MARILALTIIFGLVSSCTSGGLVPFKLDYDQVIPLDAEALAEGGISQAYRPGDRSGGRNRAESDIGIRNSFPNIQIASRTLAGTFSAKTSLKCPRCLVSEL